ncbi:zinc finger domain-containing protein [Buttiauxella ferragutiae]
MCWRYGRDYGSGTGLCPRCCTCGNTAI